MCVSLARNRATIPRLFRLYPSLYIDYHIPAPSQKDLGKSSRLIIRVKIELQNQYSEICLSPLLG
jgi:hypothetical protein